MTDSTRDVCSSSVVLSPEVTLRRGDALHLLAGMDDGCVDHVVTDPPYCSGGRSTRERTASPARKYLPNKTQARYSDFEGDNRDQRAFAHWFTAWAGHCYRVMKPGGVFLSFSDWRQLPTVTDAVQAAGFIWRGIVVWDKTESARPDKGRFRHQSEYVVWGSKGALPRPSADSPCLPGVFRHPVIGREKLHIAGKPLALMRDLLRVTRPGDLILDPFLGSGTTGLAAIETGRRFVGIEMSRPIFDAAVTRPSGRVMTK